MYTHTEIHVCTEIREIHAHTDVYTQIHIQMYIQRDTCTQMYTHSDTHTQMCAHIHICTGIRDTHT